MLSYIADQISSVQLKKIDLYDKYMKVLSKTRIDGYIIINIIIISYVRMLIHNKSLRSAVVFINIWIIYRAGLLYLNIDQFQPH